MNRREKERDGWIMSYCRASAGLLSTKLVLKSNLECVGRAYCMLRGNLSVLHGTCMFFKFGNFDTQINFLGCPDDKTMIFLSPCVSSVIET